MVLVDRTVRVERPVEQVFWFLGDPTNDPRWRREVREVHPLDRETGQCTPGASYREVVEYAGASSERVVTITDYRPNDRLAYRTDAGDVRTSGAYEVHGRGGATDVRVTEQVSLEGAAADRREALEPEIARLADDGVLALKRVLEAT